MYWCCRWKLLGFYSLWVGTPDPRSMSSGETSFKTAFPVGKDSVLFMPKPKPMQVRFPYGCEIDWPISQSDLLVKSCKDRLAALHICCLHDTQNWRETWEDNSCSTGVEAGFWLLSTRKTIRETIDFSPGKASDTSAIYPPICGGLSSQDWLGLLVYYWGDQSAHPIQRLAGKMVMNKHTKLSM